MLYDIGSWSYPVRDTASTVLIVWGLDGSQTQDFIFTTLPPDPDCRAARVGTHISDPLKEYLCASSVIKFVFFLI